MHGAPAEFLAELTGAPRVVRKALMVTVAGQGALRSSVGSRKCREVAFGSYRGDGGGAYWHVCFGRSRLLYGAGEPAR
nr:hypothetical protein GCM10017611_32700 [Rhodococcus wratislaviensis]